MALFVQIDHFRKTDQKPTVKNHLFSISWFRSFNRTSFQQQLKQPITYPCSTKDLASIVHPFNNNWNPSPLTWNESAVCFNRTSFQQQLKLNWIYFTRIERLQSYILSTTTETRQRLAEDRRLLLQSYILSTTTETFLSPAPYGVVDASIVHPFNNNWNCRTARWLNPP